MKKREAGWFGFIRPPVIFLLVVSLLFTAMLLYDKRIREHKGIREHKELVRLPFLL